MNYRLPESITPDQFLTQPSDPDDGEETPDPTGTFEEDAGFPYFEPTPIWKIDQVWQIPPAHELLAPLERIANALEGESRESGAVSEIYALREELADTEAKYESLFGLVADIEKLVSKSTSKLANSVRDAITGWKTGVTIKEPYVHDLAGEPVDPADPMVQPAHDDPVEEWRAYARSCPNRLDTGVSIDAANRSQIRTMLGISQSDLDG